MRDAGRIGGGWALGVKDATGYYLSALLSTMIKIRQYSCFQYVMKEIGEVFRFQESGVVRLPALGVKVSLEYVSRG